MIEILAVGGYSEVGKNCTAVKVDDEVIVLDLGLYLEEYIKFTEEEEDIEKLNPDRLIKAGAIPNIGLMGDWIKNVKAIIPSHAHLDHLGAIVFLEKRFDAPIICSPFSAEVIKASLNDEKMQLKNKLIALNTHTKYKLSKNIEIEFINITHSTPNTVLVAIHTKYGTIIYANDFKLDNSPILGKAPNYERLSEIGKKGVLAVIMDSIYSYEAKKTPSEAVAREMLRDVMLGTDSRGKLMVVTTFSSHLARLKSIVEFGEKIKRNVVFMGRSIAKYVAAGDNIGITDFHKRVEIVGWRSRMNKKLRDLSKKKGKYLLVVTGHQGEPRSVLSRIATGKTPLRFDKGDLVIFSCTVIPTPTNRANRDEMEDVLKRQGVRIFKDIHVSGHCFKEDQRDFLNLLKPKHIVPAHTANDKKKYLAELAYEMGWKKDSVHLLSNGDRIIVR